MSLIARNYQGEDDLPAITELLNRCAANDPFEHTISVNELRADLTGPNQEPHDDNLLVFRGNNLVGACGLWRPISPNRADAYLWFHVEPADDEAEIEPMLIEFGMKRIRAMAAPKKHAIHLGTGVKETEIARVARLRERGFIADRLMLRMSRVLDEPVEKLALPQGFAVRTLRGTEEAGKWAELFNDSFIDHWNHHPATEEMLVHEMKSDPNYNRAGDFVAVAPDGTLCAFCRCTIFAAQNEQSGKREGWIHLLGTRRGYRNRGIGRAMLHEGLAWLKHQGLTTALLGVDAQSLTGATRLYEAAGFAVIHRRTIYSLNESGG